MSRSYTEFIDGIKICLLKPNVIIGVAIFFIFNYLQDQHHVILANLRKEIKPEENKGDTGKYYGIPNGLLFNWIDCPHYFCEVLIYVSMLVICEGGFPLLWLLFGFVNLNMGITATGTYHWYRRTMKDYPKDRKRMYPGIW